MTFKLNKYIYNHIHIYTKNNMDLCVGVVVHHRTR